MRIQVAILLTIVVAVGLAVWAEGQPKTDRRLEPALVQRLQLPDGRLLQFWLEELRGKRSEIPLLQIRGELVDPNSKVGKQLWSFLYCEFQSVCPPYDLKRQVLRAAQRPPWNFVAALKDPQTVGLAFLIHPEWTKCEDLEILGKDAGFLELDINTEFHDFFPGLDDAAAKPDPAALESARLQHIKLWQDRTITISQLLSEVLPKSEIVKLMKEDKLKLRSLTYEKDRWLLQGELGDHGFEIAIREMVELTRIESLVLNPAGRSQWQVIRWWRKIDPKMRPPFVTELNRIWRLR